MSANAKSVWKMDKVSILDSSVYVNADLSPRLKSPLHFLSGDTDSHIFSNSQHFATTFLSHRWFSTTGKKM